MKKKTFIAAFILASALSVAAWAVPPSPQAANRADAVCKQMRTTLGPTTFAHAFGSLGRCISILARVEQANLTAAQAACTAEQSDPTFNATHGGQSFAQFYGQGPNGKNAFARCVAAKVKASSQAEGQARPNPARLCSAQRAASPAAFAANYGANANDRNAFGKCVSQMAHRQIQNELSAAAACRAEHGDAGFAAAHGGKTFAQLYGTNDDLSNAFGKCVAAKAKAKTQAQQQAKIAGLKACAAERKANPSAFRAKYATFASCVSQRGG